jgi:hypothetical protein
MRHVTCASLLRSLSLVLVVSVSRRQTCERERNITGPGRIVYASNLSRWVPVVAGGLVQPHRSHLGRSGPGYGKCSSTCGHHHVSHALILEAVLVYGSESC